MTEIHRSGTGGRRQSGQRPPRWLMAALCVCLCLVAVAVFSRSWRPVSSVGLGAAAVDSPQGAPSPGVAPTPEAVPSPTPMPSAGQETPAPVPTAEPSLPPETLEPSDPGTEASAAPAEEPAGGEAAAPAESGSWFSDAVFIGDSRVAGLRLYSGITPQATFLDHTGLTIYEVKEGKVVIRRGDKKISVLDALSAGSYGKVYIALGINELGYYDPEGFARTCGEVVDAVRERQPEARIYIQSLLPVNTEKCKASDTPYYVTNEGVASYNQVLEDHFADKDTYLLGIPGELLDDNGEIRKDYSADGVHFKKDGYVLWLNYLAEHTGDPEPEIGQEVGSGPEEGGEA